MFSSVFDSKRGCMEDIRSDHQVIAVRLKLLLPRSLVISGVLKFMDDFQFAKLRLGLLKKEPSRYVGVCDGSPDGGFSFWFRASSRENVTPPVPAPTSVILMCGFLKR